MNAPKDIDPKTINYRADVCCSECGRVGWRSGIDGQMRCYRCHDTYLDEEYEREIEREEG